MRKNGRMTMDKIFPSMVKVVPEGKAGAVRVEHFDISQEQSNSSKLEAGIRGNGSYFVQPGRYARLLIDDELVMSDTLMERHSNYEVYRRAHGDVLIGGLGLGMIVHAICAKDEVRTVTVVEKNRDVVTLIKPTLPKKPKRQIYVCRGDVFKWKPSKSIYPLPQRFNVIYFDIWSDIVVTNLPQMAQLHRRYGHWLDRSDPDRWMNSWQRAWLSVAKARGRFW